MKLIGATAHFAALDEGPVIEQDVRRIIHAESFGDISRRGRDIERRVFASAVRALFEDRVIRIGNRTVVFQS